ncbi:hypothetical protein [Streptomyces sp. SM11]|uniref:hypothetical protein n=1 Tax=Streptomyces sp. SM11 TaxID=565557 RepID=UPI0015E17FDE|nr:hypothetical protein [Streptomyces sp. SM11]
MRAAQRSVDLYRSLRRPWARDDRPLEFDARLRDEARALLHRAAGSDHAPDGHAGTDTEHGGTLRPQALASLAQTLDGDGDGDGGGDGGEGGDGSGDGDGGGGWGVDRDLAGPRSTP